MNIKVTLLGRLAAASALVAGLVSAGSVASAQTTAAQAAATTGNVTNVSLSTVDAKAKRQIELERENADARRVEFRNFGTSL
jgi:hypothetical protein